MAVIILILKSGIKFSRSIVTALIFGLLLIGASFWLAKMRPASDMPSSVTGSPLPVRSFIPVSDVDNNGLPDWQDGLRVPTINLDAERPTSTTMTKTAALAVQLATQSYAGNQTDAAAGLYSIGQGLVTESLLDKPYTRSDIKIGANDNADALRTYGNRVAAITFDNPLPAGTDNELTILNRALILDDAATLTSLDPIIEAYEGMVADMLATPVPPSLAREHLSLINVYNAILIDIRAFRGLFTDALPAMTRLRRYQADTDALYVAISSLYLRIDQSGIKWNENDAAAKFIKIE